MSVANSRILDTAQLTATTVDSYATLGGAQQVYLRADADCYIDFDQPAVTSRSFLLKGASNTPTRFDAKGGNINTVHAIVASGSTTLYIMSVFN